MDICQNAERRDGLVATGWIGGVPVHVLESVGLVITGGHEFDNAVGRMAGDARRLIEPRPASEVLFHVVDQVFDDRFRALGSDPTDHVAYIDKARHLRSLLVRAVHVLGIGSIHHALQTIQSHYFCLNLL